MTELVHLRTQLDVANARIRELLKVDNVESYIGVAGLTSSEATVVELLARRGRASKASIFDTLYGLDHDDPPEPKIVDVFVCKVRKKLQPYGIEIDTIWGSGYAMTPENAMLLRALAGIPVVDSPPLQPAQAAE